MEITPFRAPFIYPMGVADTLEPSLSRINELALGQFSAGRSLFQQRIKRKGLGIEMRPVWTCGSEKHYRNIYRTPNEQVPIASKSL